MKFTAEQIEYLERNIEMAGLRIIKASHPIKVDVDGCIGGYLRGKIKGDISGYVEGDGLEGVWGTVKGEEG